MMWGIIMLKVGESQEGIIYGLPVWPRMEGRADKQKITWS